MTEPTPPDAHTAETPDPVPTPPTLRPYGERARIEPGRRRAFDGLPLLYLLGALVLGSALFYLYKNPIGTGRPQEAEDTVTPRFDALNTRLAQLEQRPAPVPPNLAPLEGRVAALEGRLAALEARPAPVIPPPADLGPLSSKLDALDGRVAAAEQQAKGAADAAGQATAAAQAAAASATKPLEARIAAAEQQAKGAADAAQQAATQLAAQLDAQVNAKVGAVTETARRLSRIQAAGAALDAGQKLGEIPGAPPAVARFANEAPPTLLALRQSYPAAAEAASRASQPAAAEDRPFMDRLWTRAQQSVSIREGDRVIAGDPIAGVLARARVAIEAGDLPAALTALQGLSGPPKAAMAAWVNHAQAVVDARTALAQLAARG